MLRWLDGQANTAKAVNENLAREFMELFALGHGDGYTEDDVRAGARALTGRVIKPTGQTSMVRKRHDRTDKTLFGFTRDFDAGGFCETVLAQPKSAGYIAYRAARTTDTTFASVKAAENNHNQLAKQLSMIAAAVRAAAPNPSVRSATGRIRHSRRRTRNPAAPAANLRRSRDAIPPADGR